MRGNEIGVRHVQMMHFSSSIQVMCHTPRLFPYSFRIRGVAGVHAEEPLQVQGGMRKGAEFVLCICDAHRYYLCSRSSRASGLQVWYSCAADPLPFLVVRSPVECHISSLCVGAWVAGMSLWGTGKPDTCGMPW